MRRFLTIGIKPDGKVSILHDAESEKGEHIAKFNGLAAAKKKNAKAGNFSELQVIDLSRGVIKRKRFDSIEGDGKRTVARTVKPKSKRARPAAKKAAKRTVARTSGKKKSAPAWATRTRKLTGPAASQIAPASEPAQTAPPAAS